MRRVAALTAAGVTGVVVAFVLAFSGGTATAAHPVDALLKGTFTMKGTISVASHVYGEHAGQHVTRSWTFTPSCSSGGCPRVVLKRFRSTRHVLDKVTLKRKGPGVYVGKHRFWLALRCGSKVVTHGGYANETITVKIMRAVSNAGTRMATAIRATYNNPSRANQTRCPGNIGHDAANYSGQLNTTSFASTPAGGYLILTADGGVYKFGNATLHGSDAGKLPAGVRAVRIAADPKGSGYWILKSNGGVDAFSALSSGSLAGKLHGTRAVAIAASANGRLPGPDRRRRCSPLRARTMARIGQGQAGARHQRGVVDGELERGLLGFEIQWRRRRVRRLSAGLARRQAARHAAGFDRRRPGQGLLDPDLQWGRARIWRLGVARLGHRQARQGPERRMVSGRSEQERVLDPQVKRRRRRLGRAVAGWALKRLVSGAQWLH